MTTNENMQKPKIDLAVEKLTGFMNKDLDQARKFSLDGQAKVAEQSKLERLRKFIGHIASIDPNEIEDADNIRQRMDLDSEEFSSLLDSVAKNGVQQNLIIEFIENSSTKGYQLKCVAGHRRLAAAKIAELKTVPCLIRTFKNEGDRLEIALAENLLREDLHALDIADGYLRLSNLGWDQEAIQKYFDRNQRTVKSYLKISQWPEQAKTIVRDNSDKFSTRLIMRKYACRKFTKDEDLINALLSEISPNENSAANKKVTLSSKVQSYLETKNYDTETKKIIWHLMRDLRLVKEIPEKC